MHRLIEKSIELTYSPGYIDRLQREVYGVPEPELRTIDPGIITKITEAHGRKDGNGLLNSLLRLDKFPVDDVYLGILRKGGPEFVEKNPETTGRITDRLLSMPVEDLIRLCRKPKEGNRQLGEAFHNWVMELGFPKLNREEFRRMDRHTDIHGVEHEVLSLNGSRKDFKDFANRYLDCGVDKELDLLLKVGGNYIIGEAKYVSSFGGNQNAHIAEALDFIHSSRGDATRVAILDGVVWLDTGNVISRRIRKTESIAMSALLLPGYVMDLLNSGH